MTKKAISVTNPISYLICLGFKDIENRTWSTEHRGRLYIHSSGGFDEATLIDAVFPDKIVQQIEQGEELEIPDDAKESEVYNTLISVGLTEAAKYLKCQLNYERLLTEHYKCNLYTCEDEGKIKNAIEKAGCFHQASCIIGHVELVDIIKDSASAWAEKGCYHWVLKNPVLYERPAINIKGALRLFDVSHIDLP